jgi:hypothetical protein
MRFLIVVPALAISVNAACTVSVKVDLAAGEYERSAVVLERYCVGGRGVPPESEVV